MLQCRGKPQDCANSPGVVAETVRSPDVAKRTPIPCSEANCGENFSRCGQVSTYNYRGCRCDACRAANAEASRKHYAANPEKASEKNRRQYEKNQEARTQYQRQYYADNRERELANAKKRYQVNKPTILEQKRVYRAENAEAVRESNRRWREANVEWLRDYRVNNLEAFRGYNHKRRALLRDAFVEDVDRVAVFERDGWICQGCGIECPKDAVWPAKNFPTLEHIIPISKGGEHSYANTELLCLSCNSSKKDKQLERPVKNV